MRYHYYIQTRRKPHKPWILWSFDYVTTKMAAVEQLERLEMEEDEYREFRIVRRPAVRFEVVK